MLTHLVQKLTFALVLISTIVNPAFAAEAGRNLSNGWNALEAGLELGIFTSPQPPDVGDGLIRVLRIDPAFFRLRLLNASAVQNGTPLSARDWCRQNGLVAAINASMYQEDYRTSVSLMRTRGHINNPRLSKDMTILAFDKRQENHPHVKMIDRQCDDFEFWKRKYATLVQSIRMISCKGKNVWTPQVSRWSTAAIGTDTAGKVLFVHVQSPYRTHDLINILQALPLDIAGLMYAEGGPQAQLFIRQNQAEYEFLGVYDPDLSGGNSLFGRPIPNIVGIERRHPQ